MPELVINPFHREVLPLVYPFKIKISLSSTVTKKVSSATAKSGKKVVYAKLLHDSIVQSTLMIRFSVSPPDDRGSYVGTPLQIVVIRPDNFVSKSSLQL